MSKHWLPKKCIVVIHDLDSLRQEKEESEVQKEIRFLNKFQSIISHNERMTAWLKEKGCHSKIVNLELFDYLTENKVQIKTNAMRQLPLQVICHLIKVNFYINS